MNMNKYDLLIRKTAFYLKELFKWDDQIEDLCLATENEDSAIIGNEMLTTLRKFAETFN